MTSLADNYNRPVGALWDRRRLIVGTTLVGFGAALVLVSVLAATTSVFINAFDMLLWQAWEVSGLAAGLGIPAIFLGVYMIVPTSNRLQTTATIGFILSLVGVGMFYYWFPNQWINDPVNNSPIILTVYGIGLLITTGCMFSAIANIRVRSPGGTVSLRMVIEGKEQIVEVDRAALNQSLNSSGGSVGLLGPSSYDYVETQTAEQSARNLGHQPSKKDGSNQQQSSTQTHRTTEPDGSPKLRDAEFLDD